MVELAIVLFVVLVFVVGLVGGLGLVDRLINKPKDPRAILREKFASGEIDEAEYLRRMSILEIDTAGELD